MEKRTIIFASVGLAIIAAIAIFFVTSKPLKVMTKFGYPSQSCDCKGVTILDRCFGELINCLYLD